MYAIAEPNICSLAKVIGGEFHNQPARQPLIASHLEQHIASETDRYCDKRKKCGEGLTYFQFGPSQKAPQVLSYLPNDELEAVNVYLRISDGKPAYYPRLYVVPLRRLPTNKVNKVLLKW